MQNLILLYLAMGAQGALILIDEFYFHHQRRLPRWERVGHPLDTLSVILPFIYMSFFSSSGQNPYFLIFLMFASSVLITKDEGVHAQFAPPLEHWVHSFLFMLHAIVFILAWLVWKEFGTNLAHQIQLSLLSIFVLYQFLYWNVFSKEAKAGVASKPNEKVDNDIYHALGERWYTAKDDPVALLRAESKIKNPWVIQQIQKHFPLRKAKNIKVLDVGCGAGFLANDLAKKKFNVQGLDLSVSSLEVACAHDDTQSVDYHVGDAYSLPFPNEYFDVVTCMDFLEHVEQPDRVIAEASRVLKKDGIFVFHTFNRNPLAHFFIIKGMEWFVKNTPRGLHVIRLFLKPLELRSFCMKHKLNVEIMKGILPKISFSFLKLVFTGIVPEEFEFKISNSTWLGYLGTARKG